jgi:hypothetical protein
VCTVWQDDTPGNNDVFFAMSTDGGLTFSEPPQNISKNTGSSTDSQVVCEGDNVYVVWTDNTPAPDNFDIFFSFSQNGGQTFSDPFNISNSTGISGNPQISVEGNNVYVVWEDNNDIFFARSTDGGLTFSEPPLENISESTGDSSQPQISSDGDNVYVVWQVITPGNSDVFFARSTDGGLTFSEPPLENISENPGFSSQPQISVEGNNVYVIWEDNNAIFFSFSQNGGQTFSDPDNISENAGDSFLPQISSDGDNVYVVWYDNTTPDDNFDIFFATSTDGGLTFSELPDNNISENPGGSFLPQISSTTS